MHSTKTQVAQAIQEAIGEAFPTSNSGSHKIFVVGQLVVNVPQPDLQHACPHPGCCGRCHN